MKTRARWRGPLPAVGDYLRTSRSAYRITDVGEPRTTDDADVVRVTIHMERIDPRLIGCAPITAMVHTFLWDRRGRAKSPALLGPRRG